MINIHVVICTSVLTIACLAISHRLILLVLLDHHYNQHHHQSPVIPSSSNVGPTVPTPVEAIREANTRAAAPTRIDTPLSTTSHVVSRRPPISNVTHCSRSVESSYRSTNTFSHSADDLNWCQVAMDKHRVVIGRSWGSLSKEEKFKWDQLSWCD